MEFDPWQTDLNRALLGKLSDGLYAADTVALSIPRQVGKTFDIGAVAFALCIANENLTVIWTAHRFKVARETFNELRSLAKSPKLAPHIDYEAITTAAGNESIPFRNGSRIVFAARERGAIRGFTKVSLLVLDEAQILTHAQLADLAPTMNQSANPLIVLMGTPPKPTDPGEVFGDLRTEALSGESEGVLYVEFSAEPGSDPDDRKAWRQANPSYPKRTPARAIMRLRKLLSEEDFRREALGIWDQDTDQGVVPRAAWEALTDPDPSNAPSEMRSFGIEVDPDRAWVSIGAAGMRADDRVHLEVVDRQRGTAWVVDRCVDLDGRHGPAVFVVDGGGPAADLIPELVGAGLDVITAGLADVVAAAAGLVDGVKEKKLAHGPDPLLTEAVRGARKRPLKDGAFALGRKASTSDVTPLIAVSLAAWAVDKEGGPNLW